jgi:hypothetical protein
MRTIYRPACAQRSVEPPVEDWARAVVADPAAYCATEREAAIVADLLAELEVAR